MAFAEVARLADGSRFEIMGKEYAQPSVWIQLQYKSTAFKISAQYEFEDFYYQYSA